MPALTPEGLSDEEVTALDNMRWCRTGHYAPVAEMARDRSKPGGIGTICRPCAAARTRAARQARVDAGLCEKCDKPAEPGRRRCVIHLAAHAAHNRAAKQARRAEGRCQQTGCPNDAAPGRTYCSDHLAAQRERDRERVASGRDAAAKRALRERYKAQGFCVRGPGHGPAVPGTTKCARCRARAQKKYRKTLIEFTAILADQGVDHDGRCELCGLAEASQVDHVLPQTLGGTDDDPLLLRWVCATCNASRGNNTAWVPALTAWDVEEQLAREEDR